MEAALRHRVACSNDYTPGVRLIDDIKIVQAVRLFAPPMVIEKVVVRSAMPY